MNNDKRSAWSVTEVTRAAMRFAAISLGAALMLQAAGAVAHGTIEYSTHDDDVLGAMSIGDVVLALESGRHEPDVVAEMFNRGMNAPASAADLSLLRRAGASPALLQAVYEAPVVDNSSTRTRIIISPREFVPWYRPIWPHTEYGFRHSPPRWPPPRHDARPDRTRPGAAHPNRPNRTDRADRANSPNRPAPNRYAPPAHGGTAPARSPRVSKPMPQAPAGIPTERNRR